MFKCNKCGTEFVGDAFSKGIKVRCPNCRAVCEEVSATSSYVCSDCGLVCDNADAKCPACGGLVVKEDVKAMESGSLLEANDVKPGGSCKKNVAEILGGYTYVVLIGIWVNAIVPVAMIAFRGISYYDPIFLYPMLAMSVFSAFLLWQYYIDNIRFLKWMFYYCVLCGVIGALCALYVIPVRGGNVSLSCGTAVWVMLAWIFKKYRKL